MQTATQGQRPKRTRFKLVNLTKACDVFDAFGKTGFVIGRAVAIVYMTACVCSYNRMSPSHREGPGTEIGTHNAKLARGTACLSWVYVLLDPSSYAKKMLL